jgi:hypothetical protein
MLFAHPMEQVPDEIDRQIAAENAHAMFQDAQARLPLLTDIALSDGSGEGPFRRGSKMEVGAISAVMASLACFGGGSWEALNGVLPVPAAVTRPAAPHPTPSPARTPLPPLSSQKQPSPPASAQADRGRP